MFILVTLVRIDNFSKPIYLFIYQNNRNRTNSVGRSTASGSLGFKNRFALNNFSSANLYSRTTKMTEQLKKNLFCAVACLLLRQPIYHKSRQTDKFLSAFRLFVSN